MTDEDIKKWIQTRDAARAVEHEPDRTILLQKVYDDKDDMIMKCIAHQSDRVKHILVDHNDMVQSHKKYQEELLQRKLQEKNVNKIFTIVKYGATILGSTGLGALLMKYIGG